MSREEAGTQRAQQRVHRNLVRFLFFKDPERVVLGLPRVNDDRQPPLAGQRDLPAEDELLHVARREVVVIVQPDLAKPARQRLGVDRGSYAAGSVFGTGGELSGRVRVHAD